LSKAACGTQAKDDKTGSGENRGKSCTAFHDILLRFSGWSIAA
jgi:hypothetical protein